jgi:hypothetical protein
MYDTGPRARERVPRGENSGYSRARGGLYYHFSVCPTSARGRTGARRRRRRAPWRDLMPDAECAGVDVDSAREFGMSLTPPCLIRWPCASLADGNLIMCS